MATKLLLSDGRKFELSQDYDSDEFEAFFDASRVRGVRVDGLFRDQWGVQRDGPGQSLVSKKFRAVEAGTFAELVAGVVCVPAAASEPEPAPVASEPEVTPEAWMKPKKKKKKS